MTPPLITVRAELVRAALHFVAKGEAARLHPERAGVRFEPGPTGLIIVSMDDDAMLVLRDPDGECDRACTVRIAPSLFKSAKRSSGAIGPDRTQLYVGAAEARYRGVSMAAPEIAHAFPDWRRLVPSRATSPAPAIDPTDDERVAIVAGILTRLYDDRPVGVSYASTPEHDVVLASFSEQLAAFAVIAPLPETISAAPWSRPMWTLAAAQPEARAA